MGGCNSSSLAQGLEQRCARQLRGRRSNSTDSTSSSSSNSSASSKSSRRASQQQPSASEDATEAASSEAPDKPLGEALEASDLKPTTQQATEAKEEEKSTLAPSADAKASAAAEERRRKLEKLKEGVDFVETEEDAEAVESAVVKIQSTFRGKKFRSKLGASKNKEADEQTRKEQQELGKKEEELSKKVAGMQVNDNKEVGGVEAAGEEPTRQQPGNMPAVAEEEAERAATKIQAGFKGYKTRKELEGKLGGQQGTPGADK